MTGPAKPIFEPVDHAVREIAVQDHQTGFNVVAGAGTGKTSLLTERYVRLVESGAARPVEIVAITFTEKAASELRSRIRSSLDERGLTDALDELDRAPISTIHSFAASLLRERPFEAGLDPNFEQLDAIAAELFMRSCYERWLPEQTFAVLSRSLAAGIRLDTVRDVAFSLYGHRDLIHALPKDRERPAVDEFFMETASEVDVLWATAEAACVDTTDDGYRSIEKLFKEVDSVRSAATEIRERALLIRFETSSKGNQAKWGRPEVLKEQKSRMKILAEKLDQFRRQLRQQIFYELLEWLRSFVFFTENEKRVHGKLDFDDLLFLARDLLKERHEVRKYFQGRYRYFLIDEFQDTDPVQAEIIWYLASDGSSKGHWDTLPLVPGKLMLVGDPKQSIYRFRRASIETYETATARLTERGRRLVVSQNFRSNGPLIDWLNAVFGTILEGTYEPLTADPRHLFDAREKPIVLIEGPKEIGGANASEVRRQEAEAIAAYLKKLIDQGGRTIVDRTSRELRPIRPGDIAVLFPSTTEIDLFEEVLRRYGLPFSLEGGHLFYHRTEVHAVLAALDAIAHPTDPIAVVSALRSILFALSDQDLFDLYSTEEGFDYRNANLSKLPAPAAAAYKVLRSLHLEQATFRPSELILRLLDLSAAIPLTLTRFHGEQAVANIEKLISLARHHEQRSMFSIDQFVRWARERTEEAEQQAESSLMESGEERMRLMTVHKAKGLEFPVVVLANLSSGRDTSESVLADRYHDTLAIGIGPKDRRFSTSNYENLLAAEKGRRDDERKRLMYVAATRARDLLVLGRFVGARKSAASLWNVLDGGLPQGEPWMEQIAFEDLNFLPERSRENPTGKANDRKLDLSKTETEIAFMVSERSTKYVKGLPIQTASSLVVQEIPFAQTSKKISRTGGREFGSALHAVLERADFFRPETLRQICAMVAIEFGLMESRHELEELSRNALSSPLFDRVRKAEQVDREVPFSWMKDRTLYEGVIDLVFLEEGGLVVVDYKTDQVEGAQLLKRAAHYKPQIDLYAEALAATAKIPIKETGLFFVRSLTFAQV